MDWTQILLSIIAILSMIATAIITGLKSKRERTNGKEDRLYDFMKEQMDKQDKQMQDLQNRMISRKEFVKKEEIEKANQEYKDEIIELKKEFANFAKLSVSVNYAILKSIEKNNPDEELEKAKELLNEFLISKRA